MIRTLTVLLFLVTIAAPAQSQDLTGAYTIHGTNPGGEGGYTGQSEISLTGSTYRVTAQVGSLVAEGTGVFLNGVLSVMFPEQGWIAAYALQLDGSLQGIWSQSDGTELGQGNMTPIR